MNYREKLAVQSYCYRGTGDNADVAAKVKECGFAGIELCGRHVDFSDESTFDSIIETYTSAGVDIVSIGVCRFANDEAAERKLFEFARKAGCPTISADFAIDATPACYRTAEKLADEYDVKLGIHNHGGRHWLGSAQALGHVFAQTGPRIGLMLDTAWALHSHEDPIAVAERFADRLYGLHVKDFVFDKTGQHRDVVVGTGCLDMPRLFNLLDGAGFDGQVILEYEGDVDNPVPALKECGDAIAKAGEERK